MFNVGDKVEILNGKNIFMYSGGWTPGMEKYVGTIATIKRQIDTINGRGYELNEICYKWDERGLKRISTPIYDRIKKVIFNNPATIVIWSDDTKTVVKCQEGDTYSKELGLAMCISKKYLGNKGNFNEEFKKWIPEEPEPVKTDLEVSMSKLGQALRDAFNKKEE